MIKSAYRFSKCNLSALVITLLTNAGPAVAKECIDCHTGINAKSADIVGQMRSQSHHVQGVRLNGRHCYVCHWEATAEGKIDRRYHDGSKPNKATAAKQAKVDLVIWAAGVRPTEYRPGGTAVLYVPSAIGSSSERGEVAKVSSHCLSCHNDANNDTQPFEGDNNTPRQYAWDHQSVDSRYSQRDVTTWGKYSTAATNKKKRITKAFSAHGNSVGNQGGWSAASGYDGDMTITRGGADAKNVECFDCHNSHGSKVTGITSSYRTADGTFNGGILKETTSKKGGYRMTYKPSINYDVKSKNPYNAGAGLCFDCHESAKPGTTPWGYNFTFGAGQPIMGYKDTLHFNEGHKGSASRFANRESRTGIASSHLKAGTFPNYSTQGKVNGLCTPCHDPHGVSRTLGDKMPYAVPLLKGTWLTSPYREDGPPAAMQTKGNRGFPIKTDYNVVNSTANANFSKGESPSPRKSDLNFINSEGNSNFGIMVGGAPREPMQGMKYNVDRNTFGGDRRITDNDDNFGGLCFKCHAKENFAGNSKTALIHRTVKGWGDNKEHSFPCSKCHQSHNSGLPRLMQTNCFQEGPVGLRENSGLAWLPYKKADVQGTQQTIVRNTVSSKSKVVGCHVRQFGKINTTLPKEQEGKKWKELAPW